MGNTPAEAPNIVINIDALTAMSTEMLAAAEGCRWTEVERIDAIRSQFLKTLCQNARDIPNNELQRVLQEALAVTNRVEESARQARALCAAGLKGFNKSQQATKAYAHTGRMVG